MKMSKLKCKDCNHESVWLYRCRSCGEPLCKDCECKDGNKEKVCENCMFVHWSLS